MKETNKIMVKVMSHPILGARCCETLFSFNNSEPESVDGIKSDYFRDLGMDHETVMIFDANDAKVYTLIANALETKMKGADFIAFKNQRKQMRRYYKIAEKLVQKEIRLDLDLNLPESVIALANLPATMFL